MRGDVTFRSLLFGGVERDRWLVFLLLYYLRFLDSSYWYEGYSSGDSGG